MPLAMTWPEAFVLAVTAFTLICLVGVLALIAYASKVEARQHELEREQNR
ncbi:unannotated protein [freshwater metagenome]|uniref:Unannotated protein n=1 Tax=freshwater metagenome TaxID=449393 RepID=A0A6J7FH18_9ZZZZ|nr:hypothetical protein [Actinomycetota bacterium]